MGILLIDVAVNTDELTPEQRVKMLIQIGDSIVKGDMTGIRNVAISIEAYFTHEEVEKQQIEIAQEESKKSGKH